MNATVVDLRYRMKDVLKALDRNETVNVLYHGKVKGILSRARMNDRARVQDHPFFGLSKESASVAQQMDQLRGGRHGDL